MDAMSATAIENRTRAFAPSHDALCAWLLIAVWVGMALAIDPRGDFPIGDDFGFAPPVWTLLETGRLKLTDWGAMNLASQVGWGALFAAIFGKTYTALRLSTLVLGALGVLALYRLLRLNLTPAQALLGALMLAVNPLFLFTSYTFLTDTPYTAMQMISVWLLVTGWKRESRWRVGAGWAMAAAALLCRQVGLAIPLAAAGAYLLSKPITPRRVVFAALPILALIALQHGYRVFLDVTGGAPKLFGVLVETAAAGLGRDPGEILSRLTFFGAFALLYLGLFLLPLSLARLESPRIAPRWALLFAACMAGALAIFARAASFGQPWFPYYAGTWQFDYGIGTEFTGTPVPGAVLVAQTFIAVAGACALLFVVIPAVSRLHLRAEPATTFAILLGLILAAPLPLLDRWWDRYLIPIIPCVILALAPALRDLNRRALVVGFAAAGLLGAFSIAATHDFMAFKRAQWQAYTDLRETLPPERIDANWSINAMHFLPQFLGKPLECWHTSQEYVVWPGNRPRHIVEAVYPVTRWLPWNQGAPDVYTLHAVQRLPKDARGWGWATCGQ